MEVRVGGFILRRSKPGKIYILCIETGEAGDFPENEVADLVGKYFGEAF